LAAPSTASHKLVLARRREVLATPEPKTYVTRFVTRLHQELCMAENKTPNPKRTEIVLAWLGMAGVVGLLWWLVAE
jgi:hypothetical protein